MTIAMPQPDQGVLAARDGFLGELAAIVPPDNLVTDEAGLKTYECDGLSAYRELPLAVALPETTAEVARILDLCRRHRVKVVPRGSGTGLSGGALPLRDGLLLGLGKFNRILDIDYANRCVTVQPGVTNLAISQAVDHRGFYYAPDPSSQLACSIGGNVAENSGGVHCLKYGVTTNNLLGLEIVLMSGDIVRIGGKHMDSDGYDLLGIVTGSEGLLGVITEVTVRILPKPASVSTLLIGFDGLVPAGECVAGIIASGIIPAGLEMMDRAAVHATEEFCQAGYPLDVEALLICELDGPSPEVGELADRVEKIAGDLGARVIRRAASDEERERFWLGRKSAFPAVGRMSPDYYCIDGTIPRGRLAEVLTRMEDLSTRHGLGVVNVFHAGDGNLHPLIMYDIDKPGDLERAEALARDILTLCVEVGGVLSGEHGIGVEKRDLMGTMFSDADLKQQQRVKCAFDPDGLLNPGKVFPVLHRCAELGHMHVHRGQVPFPDLPRF
ncbi:MAG: FAD-binding protein [bacterium]|nr:FAD-binding protein [bacterium]MDE0242234.1 FAD-binding protein [bacterium]MDE0416288.1 FAD-binding protein [bacterium]